MYIQTLLALSQNGLTAQFPVKFPKPEDVANYNQIQFLQLAAYGLFLIVGTITLFLIRSGNKHSKDMNEQYDKTFNFLVKRFEIQDQRQHEQERRQESNNKEFIAALKEELSAMSQVIRESAIKKG